MLSQEFQSLGLYVVSNPQLLAAYEQNKPLLILPIAGTTGVALDLGKLTPDYRKVFLLYAIKANELRIMRGQAPLFTMGLIKACPLWKIVPPPITSLKLTKDALLKQTGKNDKVIGSASGGALKRSKT